MIRSIPALPPTAMNTRSNVALAFCFSSSAVIVPSRSRDSFIAASNREASVCNEASAAIGSGAAGGFSRAKASSSPSSLSIRATRAALAPARNLLRSMTTGESAARRSIDSGTSQQVTMQRIFASRPSSDNHLRIAGRTSVSHA